MTRHPHQRSKHPFALAVKSILFAAVLSGCATTPVSPGPSDVDSAPVPTGPEGILAAAMRAGEADAAPLFLDAADAFLTQGDTDGATRALAAVEPGLLSAADLSRYHLITAELALNEGDLLRARKAFDQIDATQVTSPRLAALEAELCLAEDDPDCALGTLVGLAGSDPAYNEQIWSLLNRTTTIPALIAPPATTGGLVDGWRALHAAVVTALSTTQAKQRLETWLSANPEHPAALAPPAAVRELVAATPGGRHIGLILPLSGPLAAAGAAVRDGFLAAIYLSGADSTLDLTIYDSTAEPVPALYERALTDGVDALVGPLTKEGVSSLVRLQPELPVLLLNYLESGEHAPELTLQIGLAIEDEALTMVRRLEREDIDSSVVFHNYEDWSVRARRTLTEHLEQDGQMHLTIQPLTDLRTITEAVGEAMHVAESFERRDNLASLIGESLEFVPRARQDVDRIIALVNHSEARSLVPALRFHYAAHIPVYASSQVARGVERSALNRLAGFRISELPLFIPGDRIYNLLSEPFQLDRNPYASLVALGVDAYRLNERRLIGREVGRVPVLGSTGLLTPEANGRVRRELAWLLVTGSGLVPDPDAPL